MTVDSIEDVKARLAAFRVGREDNFLLESAEMELCYLIAFLRGRKQGEQNLHNINME